MTTRKKWALGTAITGFLGVFVGIWAFFGGEPNTLVTLKGIAVTIGAMLQILGVKLAWPGDPPGE